MSYARLSSLPLVHGAVLGTQSTFGVGGGPCLKPRLLVIREVCDLARKNAHPFLLILVIPFK